MDNFGSKDDQKLPFSVLTIKIKKKTKKKVGRKKKLRF